MLIAPAAPPLTATLPAGCWPPTSNVVPPDTGAAPVPYVPSGCWPPTSNVVPPEPASPLTTTGVAAPAHRRRAPPVPGERNRRGILAVPRGLRLERDVGRALVATAQRRGR